VGSSPKTLVLCLNLKWFISYDMFIDFIVCEIQSHFPLKLVSLLSRSFYICYVVGHIELLGLKSQFGIYLNIVEYGLYIALILPLFIST
jgi:hypothetical protein